MKAVILSLAAASSVPVEAFVAPPPQPTGRAQQPRSVLFDGSELQGSSSDSFIGPDLGFRYLFARNPRKRGWFPAPKLTPTRVKYGLPVVKAKGDRTLIEKIGDEFKGLYLRWDDDSTVRGVVKNVVDEDMDAEIEKYGLGIQSVRLKRRDDALKGDGKIRTSTGSFTAIGYRPKKDEASKWTDKQLDQLRQARREVPGRGGKGFDQDSYWRVIASYVPGKDADECRAQSRALEYQKAKGSAAGFNLGEESGLLVYSQPVIRNGQVFVPQGRRMLGRNKRFYEDQQKGLDAALKAKVGDEKYAEIMQERKQSKVTEAEGREYAAVMAEVRPRDFRYFLGLPPTDEQMEKMEARRRKTSYERRAAKGKGKAPQRTAAKPAQKEERKFLGVF
uniref:Myb-like domain-containing protein n=1 Tax=Chromera velia CCMP2878 TaxID=1169474 RepID=A0A0G4I8I0_9ALVE|eukprot:Cvel_11964.t1-p1 / transcript=Cvel_11964.t1 / gene=Cvel_11964 / organism=Chromera_velia_CCMP2878 / gene_product=hypothetical protein / transcript_product=hypothetical protein / location=Cvel_scaffold766:64392-65955(+) / protein_length=389 / sequence_SO=supercontig / SO=protein_coding / is_pseudo=false